MPCRRQLVHDWTFRKREQPVEDDEEATCATYVTQANLRQFTRRKGDTAPAEGYPNVFEGNPPDVPARPAPSQFPPSQREVVRGPTEPRLWPPPPPTTPRQPEPAPKDAADGLGRGKRRPKSDEGELSPARLRLWKIETAFLERRGIQLETPIRAMSPIAAARALLREPPCPLNVHDDLKPPKRGRYPPLRRAARVLEKSKVSRPKVPVEERHQMRTRCGPDTLCTYLAKNSVYRPLANALLRLYVERPDKPAALERLRIMMGDSRPDMDGFHEMKKDLDRVQEELHVYLKENHALKRQLDHLDRLRHKRQKKGSEENVTEK